MPYGTGVGMQGALQFAGLRARERARTSERAASMGRNVGGAAGGALAQSRANREQEQEEADVMGVLSDPNYEPTTQKGALLKSQQARQAQQDALAASAQADRTRLAEDRLLWGQQQDEQRKALAAKALEYERAGDADVMRIDRLQREGPATVGRMRGAMSGMGIPREAMLGLGGDAPAPTPRHIRGVKYMGAQEASRTRAALAQAGEDRRGRTEGRLGRSRDTASGLTFYQALRTAKGASKTTDPITGVTKYAPMDEIIKAAKELMKMAQGDAEQAPQEATRSGASGMTTEQIEARLAEIRSRGR